MVDLDQIVSLNFSKIKTGAPPCKSGVHVFEQMPFVVNKLPPF